MFRFKEVEFTDLENFRVGDSVKCENGILSFNFMNQNVSYNEDRMIIQFKENYFIEIRFKDREVEGLNYRNGSTQLSFSDGILDIVDINNK